MIYANKIPCTRDKLSKMVPERAKNVHRLKKEKEKISL